MVYHQILVDAIKTVSTKPQLSLDVTVCLIIIQLENHISKISQILSFEGSRLLSVFCLEDVLLHSGQGQKSNFSWDEPSLVSQVHEKCDVLLS